MWEQFFKAVERDEGRAGKGWENDSLKMSEVEGD